MRIIFIIIFILSMFGCASKPVVIDESVTQLEIENTLLKEKLAQLEQNNTEANNLISDLDQDVNNLIDWRNKWYDTVNELFRLFEENKDIINDD